MTEPPARQTGDLITAEIWNTDVVDNLRALHDANFRGVHDSGWFAVTYNTAYEKAHGLNARPGTWSCVGVDSTAAELPLRHDCTA